MLLLPREKDCLLVHAVGFLAQKRYARGLKLNYTEACGLIAAQLLELIRDGHTVAELAQTGKEILGSEDVLAGVGDMLREVQVEGTFPDASWAQTLSTLEAKPYIILALQSRMQIHGPICRRYGNSDLALYGSFIELPAALKQRRRDAEMQCGMMETFGLQFGSLPGNALHSACESECAKAVPGAASVMSYPGETIIDNGNETSEMDTDADQMSLTPLYSSPLSQGTLSSDTVPVITGEEWYSNEGHSNDDKKKTFEEDEPLGDWKGPSNEVSDSISVQQHLEVPYEIQNRLFTVTGQPLVSLVQQRKKRFRERPLPSLSKKSAKSQKSKPMIELNQGRKRILLTVTSTCDRPIQVGSHFHFIEVNPTLRFDRIKSLGMRLNIPAGHSVRFEPGETLEVPLVEIGGRRRIHGGNFIVDGPVIDCQSALRKMTIEERLKNGNFLHEIESVIRTAPPTRISRELYAKTFGPTVGDRVRLADSCILIEIEKDYAFYGDECRFGVSSSLREIGGKVLREGMGQMSQCSQEEALDVVITNAIIIDAVTGIVKADIGIKDGKIIGIGKAGNPDVMDDVHPKMFVGVSTECIAEGLILTSGAIDTHVHFICPQLIAEALSSGITTLIGGGTGPAAGTKATTCTPGKFHIQLMAECTDSMPINIGLTGKGNSSAQGEKRAADLVDQVVGGAIGLKLHEDWGTTPAAIESCLAVADDYDIQVTIHTDTLNESSCVEGTIDAFKKRTIHTYHTEGAGGGHAPDILRVVGEPNVIPSSTNPTRPFTVNTVEEHIDMLVVCHHLDNNLKEDISFAESRIRAETIQAEDILHDLGAISLISSDAQAMGRIGEVISRTWQTAAKMKEQRGSLPPDAGSGNDNFRVKRYIAKYTMNPAIAHGISHFVGSVSEGLLADLVIWSPAFFGMKPKVVIKGGQIVWSEMGLANASIPTPEPVISRPMFGAYGKGPSRNSVLFVSQACIKHETPKKNRWRVSKALVPVVNCRKIGKKDMILNNLCPEIRINPENYQVQIKCEVTPSRTLTTTASSCHLTSLSSQGNQLESWEESRGAVYLPTAQTPPQVCSEIPTDRCAYDRGVRPITKPEEVHLGSNRASNNNTEQVRNAIADTKNNSSPQQEGTQNDASFSRCSRNCASESKRERLDEAALSVSSSRSMMTSRWVTLECEPAEILPLAQRYLLF